MREAGDGRILTLLSARLDSNMERQRRNELIDDPRLKESGLSRSVIIGWVVFGAFTPPGTLRGILEIANELGLSPSTTHSPSCGKALLACLPEKELEGEIGAMRLAPRAPNTITGKRTLRAELERIREAGWFAVNDQELVEGLYSVAAPVRCGEKVAGAINMVAHTLRLLVEADGLQVVETAYTVSVRLSDARKGQLSNGSSRHG